MTTRVLAICIILVCCISYMTSFPARSRNPRAVNPFKSWRKSLKKLKKSSNARVPIIEYRMVKNPKCNSIDKCNSVRLEILWRFSDSKNAVRIGWLTIPGPKALSTKTNLIGNTH